MLQSVEVIVIIVATQHALVHAKTLALDIARTPVGVFVETIAKVGPFITNKKLKL